MESKYHPEGKKARKREAWKAMRESEQWWQEFSEKLSSGRGNLKYWLDAYEIPRSSYFRYIAAHPERKAQVEAALESIGHNSAQQAAEAVDDADLSDPKMLRLYLEQKRWEASKYAPRTYGERQRIDVTHSVNPKSHLDALREMSQRPKLIDVTPTEATDESKKSNERQNEAANPTDDD